MRENGPWGGVLWGGAPWGGVSIRGHSTQLADVREGAFHEKFPYEDVTMKRRFAYAYSYKCVYMAICGPNHLVIPLPSLFLYHLLFKTMTRVVHHYLNVVWTALIWMSTVLCIHRTILYWVKSAKNLGWNFRIRINPHDCTSTSVFAILYSAKMGPWKVLNFQCGYLT